MWSAIGFSILQGEPVIGGLHGPTRHFFCPYCLSWMFTRPEGLDFFVNLRATMLDDASWLVPFVETCTSEKLPWVTTPAVYSFESFPPADRYTELLQAYASQAAKPAR